MSGEVFSSLCIPIGITVAELEHAKARFQLEQGLAEPMRFF
jgi:hypothetical protein